MHAVHRIHWYKVECVGKFIGKKHIVLKVEKVAWYIQALGKSHKECLANNFQKYSKDQAASPKLW